MSSRIDEKERRKAERLEAQRQAEQAAARVRLLQIAGGVVVAVAIVVTLIIVLSTAGGGSSTSGSSANSPVAQDIKGITLPAAKLKDLKQAAAAAGCTVTKYPIEGRSHVTTLVTYKANPPTSGNHNGVPAADGVYDPANAPAKENFVHSLEHGRVEYQYAPGTPPAEVKQLEALWNEQVMGTPGYKQLLFQNNTKMGFAVAATAWGESIGCKTFGPKIFDALRDFRIAYLDKGPEQIAPS